MIAALAAHQHGVVSRRQLSAAGLGAKAIDYRLLQGRLIALHRGVYAVGHAELRREGRWMAAALAYGPGAALSHYTAAAAWSLRTARGRIDVTVTGRNGMTTKDGTRVHRARSLLPPERRMLGCLPVTSVARTLLDLAPLECPHQLEQLIHQADVLEVFDLREAREVLVAHPTRAGAPKLRAVLDRLEGVGAQRTRSELEIAFRALCDRHGLPQPVVNARVAGYEVDFHWPGTTLIVETDGSHHRMPEQRERDHAKRLALEAAGFRVVTLTYRQVTRQPAATAAQLRAVLARSSRS